MKNRKNLFYISMFAICVLVFTACGDDETYDVYGDPYNRVYVLDNSKEYKIVQTPISTVSNVDFTWEAKCSKKASGDIRVTVAVDNSLIDAYNEEHDTEFEALPVEAIVLENKEMTIPAGEMVVADAVHLKLTDDVNVLSTLKSEKGYIVPLRLVSAEGGNSQLSTNMLAPSFLTITVTEDNMNHEATQYTGTGTLVAGPLPPMELFSLGMNRLKPFLMEIMKLIVLSLIGRVSFCWILIWGKHILLIVSK